MPCRKSTIQKTCSSSRNYCIFSEESTKTTPACICICIRNGKIICCVPTEGCNNACNAEEKKAGGCACKSSKCLCQGKKTSCCCDGNGCNCGVDQKYVRSNCCSSRCKCLSVSNVRCGFNEAKERSCVCCFIKSSGDCVCVAYKAKNCSDCSADNICKCIKKCCASVEDETTCNCCNKQCLGDCIGDCCDKTKCCSSGDSGKVECHCCKEKCLGNCICTEKNEAGCQCCIKGCNCTNIGFKGDKPKCCTTNEQTCNCCNKKCLGKINAECGSNGCKCATICKCNNSKFCKGNNDCACSNTKCNCVTNKVTENIDDACKDCVCNGDKKCGKDGCACEPIGDSIGDGYVNVEDSVEEKTEVGKDLD